MLKSLQFIGILTSSNAKKQSLYNLDCIIDCMNQTLDIKQVKKEVFEQLKEYNDRMWNAIHFSLIYGQLRQEPELKKLNIDKNVKEYRKERYEKAMALAKGDKLKAYNLLASEDFY